MGGWDGWPGGLLVRREVEVVRLAVVVVLGHPLVRKPLFQLHVHHYVGRVTERTGEREKACFLPLHLLACHFLLLGGGWAPVREKQQREK